MASNEAIFGFQLHTLWTTQDHPKKHIPRIKAFLPVPSFILHLQYLFSLAIFGDNTAFVNLDEDYIINTSIVSRDPRWLKQYYNNIFSPTPLVSFLKWTMV